MKFLRKLKAKLLGTFVTDCPVCDKHFYGHENHKSQVNINNINYRIVCPRCAKDSK